MPRLPAPKGSVWPPKKIFNYLKATGIEVGLLINFGHSVQVKRKVFDKIKLI
ncbi:MAG: hypothetical protein KKH68_03620 [Proteobacteria bacterium]|nr:hypothetical protein [Pseudomonadota bacterium]